MKIAKPAHQCPIEVGDMAQLTAIAVAKLGTACPFEKLQWARFLLLAKLRVTFLSHEFGLWRYIGP
jgi:hypothetical protein